ncbi:hypothetical protein EHP00_1944 [Ecytonucleospora hepatopenaei]|uniref:Phosphotransferase n=1 Tax=Ecytonucleospora hepatopenaei TaxID=646526 RepID=A0A1W0E9D9_9MICR|nr:hypothetical protein EHP00_1944 [Ecytonucleospora hepatopenaei]
MLFNQVFKWFKFECDFKFYESYLDLFEYVDKNKFNAHLNDSDEISFDALKNAKEFCDNYTGELDRNSLNHERLDFEKKHEFKKYVITADLGGSTFKMRFYRRNNRIYEEIMKEDISLENKTFSSNNCLSGSSATLINSSSSSSIPTMLSGEELLKLKDTKVEDFIEDNLKAFMIKCNLKEEDTDFTLSFSYKFTKINGKTIKLDSFSKNFQFCRKNSVVSFKMNFIYIVNDCVAMMYAGYDENCFNIAFVSGTGYNMCYLDENNKICVTEAGQYFYKNKKLDEILGGMNTLSNTRDIIEGNVESNIENNDKDIIEGNIESNTEDNDKDIIEGDTKNIIICGEKVESYEHYVAVARILMRQYLLEKSVVACINHLNKQKKKVNLILNGTGFIKATFLLEEFRKKYKYHVKVKTHATIEYFINQHISV